MTSEVSKILIIEDEEDVINFFTDVFKSYPQVKFFSASRTRQGIEIAKQEKPKVILIDLRMPDLNGEDALAELKPLLPETKFMIMTGWEDNEAESRIRRKFKVEAYYHKPIDLEDVMAKISELISEK